MQVWWFHIQPLPDVAVDTGVESFTNDIDDIDQEMVQRLGVPVVRPSDPHCISSQVISRDDWSWQELALYVKQDI